MIVKVMKNMLSSKVKVTVKAEKGKTMMKQLLSESYR